VPDETGRLLRPRKRVAPDTHPVELERLTRQERIHADCDPLHVQTVIWVMRAYSAVVHAQTEELRAIGLSPSGFNVLMALMNSADGALEPRDISERLLVSRPSVTGLLDTLERAGFVTRDRHPGDGRRVIVRLTDSAARLLQRHFPVHYAAQAQLLADLTDDELAHLVQLLRKIRGATPPRLRDTD
jgi:DNA-binding MarR family transcriptional regulator